MPTTPSGCGISRLRAGKNCSAVAMRCGAIQLFRCLVACRISENTIIVSAMVVSTAERWPKSAEIACRKRSSLSATTARSRASRSSRSARSGRRLGPRPRDHGMEGVLQRSNWDARRGAFQGTVQGAIQAVVVHGVLPILTTFRLVLLPQAGPLWNFWQGHAKWAGNRPSSLL
ncbi:hypothetical protein ACVWZZ_005273 [Bradyrhizobium sp. LM6.10]